MGKRFLTSLGHSARGFAHAMRTERHMRIHTAIYAAVLAGGVLVGAETVELAILLLAGALVIVTELVNTAIERLTDLEVHGEYHPVARVAKDVAAAAVLFAAAVSIAAGVLVGLRILGRWGIL